MPACLTHNLFAADVLSRLEETGIDKCAYAWGAQGPDFLFCHRYLRAMRNKSLKTLQEYGSMLHRTSPSKTLEAMRKFVFAHNNPIYRSYALGFVCHYSLDSTAHPYVNARAEKMAKERENENESTMHGEIEASLDTIVLRWKTGKLPGEVRLKDTFPKNEGVQRMIARLYRELLFEVYGADVSEEALYQSTKDAHLLFAACNDRTGLKRSLFNIIEKGRPHHITSHLVPVTEDPEADFANTAHDQWTRGGETHTEDFFQLYDRALELAAELCGGFDSIDFVRATGERPFG